MANQYINNMTVTWNAGGTTFDAIKMNVTDSASAAASMLLTLQVGGATMFGIRKDGQIQGPSSQVLHMPPSTTVDNTLPRFDGVTGKLQTSGITVDDADKVTADQLALSKTDGTGAAPTLTIGSAGFYGGDATDILYVSTSGTRAAFFHANGDFTAEGNITANSDERLKTDWEDVDADFVTRLAGVRSGSYRRTDTGARQVGVGAQSLQMLLPEAVVAGPDGIMSVAYGNAALVACIELAKEVVALRRLLEATAR